MLTLPTSVHWCGGEGGSRRFGRDGGHRGFGRDGGRRGVGRDGFRRCRRLLEESLHLGGGHGRPNATRLLPHLDGGDVNLAAGHCAFEEVLSEMFSAPIYITGIEAFFDYNSLFYSIYSAKIKKILHIKILIFK